ncbi:TetR family transcriptional regulator [Nocardioidaceae bacterium SCSIO 66511]|nr:TetR family transcriptional regulator [Nocardioidaceae bacterium SCSIO 66511]
MSSAEQTRAQILAAATTEFTVHGLAGARVDRIAANAGASKPMIYAYFGGKDTLFDRVFESHVIANKHRVPFTPDDLPGYAVRLYEDYLGDPALVRLLMWKRLEQEPEGYLYPGMEDHDAKHRDDIARAQAAGTTREDLDPADIWSLLISIAATWAQNSITAVASAADPGELHERRKRALETAVREMFHPRTKQ